MDRLIRKVTSSITEKLPDNTPYFTPDDLRDSEIPEFVVQRVEMEIYRNLNESIVPPHSDWADMSAEDVEHAWEQFIQAILEEVRLPAAYISTVFETSIGDVIEMILKPRTAIPEILFGPEKILTSGELEKRVPFITVNAHLAQALLRFMTKKGRDRIDLETAREVIAKVDDRITANYNSLNWAQLLQPLFLLAGPKIDTEMLRIFFKDRKMDRASRRFDLLNSEITKTEFIETMSSPDLLNEEGYDDDQASLFEMKADRAEEEKAEARPGSPEDEYQAQTGQKFNKDEEDENFGETVKENDPAKPAGSEDKESNTTLDQEEDNDTLLGSFQSRLRKRPGEAEELESEAEQDKNLSSYFESDEPFEEVDADEGNEQDRPLYSRFDEDQDPEVSEKETPDSESETDEKSLIKDDQPEAEEPEEERKPEYEEQDAKKPEKAIPESSEGEFDQDHELETGQDSEDDTPIWQSFLGDEAAIEGSDIPEYSAFAEIDEEEAEDEPLIDLTVKEEDERPERLIGWLRDDEDRFKEGIFSGSYEAYEDSLMNLESLDNWQQASRYIEKEIFARNLVDMYDEEAVDFTDRLQAYFDEFKS